MEEEIKKLDIRDFQSLSSVSDDCSILLVQLAGSPNKITYALLRNLIKKEIAPSIRDGKWYVGEINQNIIAEGRSPIFRKGKAGIEWKYSDEADDTYRFLVDYDSITLNFDELTAEQREKLRLKFSDLTEAEIEELQKPAKDMVEVMKKLNDAVSKAEDGRVSAESGRVAAESGRVTSEQERVNAESKRVTECAAIIGDVTKVKGAAQKAADNAEAKANYAKEEGDRAAALSDQVSEFIPIVMSESEYEKLQSPDPKRIYYTYEE